MYFAKTMHSMPRTFRCQPRMLLLSDKFKSFRMHPFTQGCDKSLLISRELCRVPDNLNRNFSKVTDNYATELYFEEIFEQGFIGEDLLFDLRNYFYPESDDPLIMQLSHAGCVVEVLEAVTNLETFRHQYITQAVATIHHLQKLIGYVGKADHHQDFRNNREIFNEQLREYDTFKTLCDIIQNNLKEFPYNELAFLMMALRKFDEPLSSPVLRDIYLHLQENMNSLDTESLSYLSVGVRPRLLSDKYLPVWRIGLAKAMPRLQHLLTICSTPEDLRQVAICFYNMSFLVSDRLMDQMAQTVTQFIERGELASPAKLPVLCKLLALMVAKKDWHEEHYDYVHLLLSQFKGKAQYLRPVNAIMLARIINDYGEPVTLYYEVYHRLCEILSTKQFQGNLPMVSCLSSALRVNPSAIPLKDIEEIVENIVNSEHLVDHVNDIYQIMRNVGIINDDLVDKFFLASFEALKNENSSELLRFAVRYTNMNSVFTGHYYNKEFEQKIIDFVLEEMKVNNPICLHPLEFARRIGMLITFGHRLPSLLDEKLQDMLPQLCTQGLLTISRGIQYQQRKSRRDILNVSNHPVPRDQKSPFMEWIEEMSIHVGRASAAKLIEKEGENANVKDLAYILKNFTMRNDFFDEELFNHVTDCLIQKVNQGNISIKMIGQISSALRNSRIKVENPKLIQCLIHFFLCRPDPSEIHIGHTSKLLKYCYETGYEPDQKFLHMVCQGLLRDVDSLFGLETMQLAHILCHYNSISKNLVTALFSNEFMAKLDSEMELTASRKQYLKQLRRSLMELNRSVTLRHPEIGVPWFHRKYCHENSKELTTFRRSPEGKALKEEVSEELQALTGGWRFVREDTHSEYYNPIAFEIQYDERGQPVDLNTSKSNPRKVKKFAIQVLPISAFTADTKKLSGGMQSHTRELELQGWTVINVDPFSWNSLQMGEGKAKNQFLKHSIAQAVAL